MFEYAVNATLPAAALSVVAVALVAFAVGWLVGRRRR